MKRTPIKRKNKRMFKGPEYEDPEYLKLIEALHRFHNLRVYG